MNRPSTNVVARLAATFLLGAVAPGARAEGMTVASRSFDDGGSIPSLHAASGECGGQDIPPQVSWSAVPAGTKSVVVLFTDPDGAKGLGVVHWMAYGIAAERSELREGEGTKDDIGILVGRNSRGIAAYLGMCPPSGDRPHHFVLTVIATDLATTTLPAGLERDDVMKALKGHALGAQSVVGRYAR